VVYTVPCSLSGAAGSLTNSATIAAPGGVTDPNPSDNSATDTDTVIAALGASASGTKSVAGPFAVGDTVTYTIVLQNSGPGPQSDNPGNEFTDILPPQLALVSASATSGTAVATIGTNTVTWNGTIPVSGSVTITIHATILPAAIGTIVSNQGTISYDSNGDGTNDATAPTDDPSQGGSGDSTAFAIVNSIPMLSGSALLLLLAMIAGVAVVALRRA
jgi:uncharacterized repeat protein (TIGR01451 family)